jgi:phage regulator Rha-like protein
LNARKSISLSIPSVADRIRTIRGQRVILDSDLAALYGVTTGRFNEAVARNLARFPRDFMFRLSDEEFGLLISQIATSSSRHGGRRKAPYVFTEHGAIMAAGVLNSQTAMEISVFVVRAFVELREALASHKELTQRLDELETRIEKKLSIHDRAISELLSAIRSLMSTPGGKSRPIGFVIPDRK